MDNLHDRVLSWVNELKDAKVINLRMVLEKDYELIEQMIELFKGQKKSVYVVLSQIIEESGHGSYSASVVNNTMNRIRAKHDIPRSAVAPVKPRAAVSRKVDMSKGVGVSSPVAVGNTAAVVPGVELPAPVSLDTINWQDERRRLEDEEEQGIDTLLPQDMTFHDYFLGLFKENGLDCVRDFDELFKKKIINEQKHEIMGKVRSKLMANGIKFRK